MGAREFYTKARGTTAREAFNAAIDEARYQYGHRSYTGTIAEKDSFRVVRPHKGETPRECAERHVEEEGIFDDKWGPAGCVKLGEGEFLFFGWASS